MKHSAWTMSSEEMAGFATKASHQMLCYLLGQGIITQEQYDQLVGGVIICAVPNHKNFGERVLAKLGFKEEDSPDHFSFPIVELARAKVKTQ